MAKKSTAKTGTKKKTAAKKKATRKKVSTTAKKSTPKKKSAGKPSKKTILKRKFNTWIPGTLFAVQPDTEYEKAFSAPPVFAKKKKDSARLKKLLLKPATLEAIEEKNTEKAPSPKKPAAKKKETPKKSPVKGRAENPPTPAAKKKPAVSIKTLLMQKFESLAPEFFNAPITEQDENAVFAAPPAIDGADPDRAEGLKALLVKTIDFKSPVEPFPVPEEIKAELKPGPGTAETEVMEPQPGAEPEAGAEPDAIEEPGPAADTKAGAEPEAQPDIQPEPVLVPEGEPVKETGVVPEGETPETDILQPSACRGCIAAGLSSMPGPLKALITFTAVIIVLIVTASLMNIRHYYLVPTRTGIEILKGNFTPMGKEDFAFLPMAEAPEKIKNVYTKSEVYTVIYQHYIKKAGVLCRSKSISDLKNAKKCIDNARAYALSSGDFDRAGKQLDRINAKIKAITPAPVKKTGKTKK